MRLLTTYNLQLTTKKRAFTLIEILVVVAIIGVLAAIVILNLDKAQARSRDARRQADLDGLMKATRMYFTEKKALPVNPTSGSTCRPGTGTCLSELVAGGYIQNLPLDPKNDATYIYTYYDYTGSANATNGVMFSGVMEEPRRFGPFPYGLFCSNIWDVGNWAGTGVAKDAVTESTIGNYCVGFMSK